MEQGSEKKKTLTLLSSKLECSSSYSASIQPVRASTPVAAVGWLWKRARVFGVAVFAWFDSHRVQCGRCWRDDVVAAADWRRQANVDVST